jgi:uncharacterized SAM-dependent methyltransferase
LLTGGEDFDIVELGAGDGTKTQILLRHLLKKDISFRYIPVDISSESNLRLYRRLKGLLPSLSIDPISDEYFDSLKLIRSKDSKPTTVLFLGSNVGNFSKNEAIEFYKTMWSHLKQGDQVLTGFDLKKEPATILAAYNDSQGVTSEFNLNLLHRLNREMGANFDLGNFSHYPVYDPGSGAALSYLISTKDQLVKVKAIKMEVTFREWEAIFTEISLKYDIPSIKEIALESGFEIVENFIDANNYFVDSLWKRSP